MVRKERPQYGEALTVNRRVQGIKKPNLKGLGNDTYTGPFSLERLIQSKTKQVSWLAASAYSLRLPKAFASVAIADFVPLTVAGQRWLCTIFPDRKLILRYNLVFDPY